jgi:RND family efflux transporter MFP subunit
MKKTAMAIILVAAIALMFGCGKANVISASGTVEDTEADLASRISSRVTKLYVDEGAMVKKGDVLAELDPSIVVAQRDAAASMCKQAEDYYNRTKNLFETSSTSLQSLDNARAAYISAQKQLVEAQVMLDEAKVIAPWSGVILKKHVEVGELVSSSTPLFTLGDVALSKVTIYLPLVDIGKITYGEAARVRIDSYTNKWLDGKITFISSDAEFTPKNVQTQDERIKEVFEVQVTVPNPDYILKPGIPADVEIDVK